MATKTDRILSYLPPTFRALPRPTALYSVVDAFGGQLLSAENSLSAVMLSHWVDFADKGSEFITDLNCFASLYGLAPRGSAKDVAQFAGPTCAPVSADETVEEFREHLKRYVRTYIEGTVTVQGILRIVAEALGIHIADDYASMDTWWTSGSDTLVSSEPRSDNAVKLLFGTTAAEARGVAASSARVTGKANLSAGIDLSGASNLRIKVDSTQPLDVDLGHSGNRTTLRDVVAAINARLRKPIASDAGGHLRLSSSTAGPASRLELLDTNGDAASKLLGLPPRGYYGRTGTGARVTGHVDLSHGVNLSRRSKIRLRIDGGPGITIDCAGASNAKTELAEIVSAINHATNTQIARDDGRHIVLESETSGAMSSILFESVEAGDATDELFGIGPRVFHGAEASAARLAGTADLSHGVSLAAQHLLQISVDGRPPVELDLWAGSREWKAVSATTVRTALNRGLGARVVSDDGRRLFLTSETTGPTSSIAISPIEDTRVRRFVTRAYITDEAAPAILGFLRGSAAGTAATAARLQGAVDLSSGVDLRQSHVLRIVVDELAPIQIDFAVGVGILRGATLPEIVSAINTRFSFEVASDDGRHLILTSPGAGARSGITLEAVAASDARAALFGPNKTRATGKDPGPAIIKGEISLRTPINLGERNALRLAVDNQPPIDVDVSGAAPDRTFLDEIVAKINAILPGVASATADDRLVLASPTSGEAGALELLPLRALELIEYPPGPVDEPAREVQHGDQWSINNDGAADSEMELEIAAPQGEAGVQFVDRTGATRLRVMDVILPGETMRIRRGGETGVQAEITAVDGETRMVADANILAGTFAAEARVPFTGDQPLSVGAGAGQPLLLQLNDPAASAVAVLRAVIQPAAGDRISVSVSPAVPHPSPVISGGKRSLAGRLRVDASEYHLLDEREQPIARLVPATATALRNWRDRVVTLSGSVHIEHGTLPTMRVERIASLFDVTVRLDTRDKPSVTEMYNGVTIGQGATAESLPLRLLSRPSQFVRAEEMDKAELLMLPRGTLELTYMNSHASRFDQVKFASQQNAGSVTPAHTDDARFVGGSSSEWPVFGVSRFSDSPPTLEAAFFGPGTAPDPAVQVGAHWDRYQPGAFEVNLPADLGEEFGARFDQSRFGLPGSKPEAYNGVVTEPDSDPNWLVHRINTRSTLVSASHLDGPVPPGWEALTMPFEHPRSRTLSGGSDKQNARMYLAEDGVAGVTELRAKLVGAWGNTIAVTSKKAGPVRFDITIGYQGARFENAREVALAGRILKPGEDPLPGQTAQIVKPGPVGALQAKATGVRVDVTRDRTDAPPESPKLSRLRRAPRPGFPYLAFNGENSYVDVPDSDAFSVSTTGELTVSAWMRPDTLNFPHDERGGYVHWLGKGEGQGRTGNQEWAFRMYNHGNQEDALRPNRISFYVFNPWGGLGIGSYFQDPVEPGEWIHVVGAVDGTRTFIFKNGAFRKCDQYRGAVDRTCGRHAFIVTPIHGPGPLRMGHVDGQSYFLGAMAEVRIWNRVLARKEVAALYAANRVPRDGLVAEYLLNEGRGDVVHDTVDDHDGTIINAKWR